MDDKGLRKDLTLIWLCIFGEIMLVLFDVWHLVWRVFLVGSQTDLVMAWFSAVLVFVHDML